MNTVIYCRHLVSIIKKIIPILMVVTTGIKTSWCQKLNEDSIKKIISESTSDTTRILAERKLASYYILHQGKDSAGLALLEKAGAHAKKIHFQVGVCEVLLTRGNYYFKKNDWANAIAAFTELVEQSHLVKDSFYNRRTRMMGLNNLAGIFTQNGDYTKALGYYFNSRDILESFHADSNSYSIVYVNIASIYNVLEQPKKAKEYLDKCYPYIKGSRPNLRYLYWQEKSNTADKYNDGQAVSLAIDSLEKTIKTAVLSDVQRGQYNETLLDMKGRYNARYPGNYTVALENFTALLGLARKMEDRPVINNTLFEIGDVYDLQNNTNKAIAFLEDAYKGAVADSVNQVAFTAAKELSDIYNKQKDNGKALYYLSVAYKLNDSLNIKKILLN